jgi:pyridoxine kinase
VTRVLILSSFVAASRVGGGAQALAFARLGIDPVLAPTVLFGRHPGHGPPGGARVTPWEYATMLEAIAAQGVFGGLAALVTGYFASPEQVAAAAKAIAEARQASPAVLVVVDPVMGDADKGLYIAEPTAQAIASELVPAADLVCPNAWELARLCGRQPLDGPADAASAARSLGRTVMVSSVAEPGRIGAVLAGPQGSWFAAHPTRRSAPKGAGDLLTAFFVAGLLAGEAPPDALASAVGAIAEAVTVANGADEFPLEALPMCLPEPHAVRLQRLGA